MNIRNRLIELIERIGRDVKDLYASIDKCCNKKHDLVEVIETYDECIQLGENESIYVFNNLESDEICFVGHSGLIGNEYILMNRTPINLRINNGIQFVGLSYNLDASDPFVYLKAWEYCRTRLSQDEEGKLFLFVLNNTIQQSIRE